MEKYIYVYIYMYIYVCVYVTGDWSKVVKSNIA